MEVIAANAVLEELPFSSAEAFWSYTDDMLRRIKAQGAQLVLFPGLTGFVHSQTSVNSTLDLAELVPYTAEQAGSFEQGFGNLAAKYRLYLCPGTTIVNYQQRYYLTAALFDPQGKKIGEQFQTHLSQEEITWGLARGEELAVWPTPIGKLGLVVGTDIWHPEVSRILALQGADLVLAPAAVPAPYNQWLQVAAMWQEVQQNQFFALENWLKGTIGNTAFQGNAPILAPCEMTPRETGYLTNGNKTSVAKLDFARRQKVIEAYPILKHLNPPLYQQYLPAVYERGGSNAASDSDRKNP